MTEARAALLPGIPIQGHRFPSSTFSPSQTHKQTLTGWPEESTKCRPKYAVSNRFKCLHTTSITSWPRELSFENNRWGESFGESSERLVYFVQRLQHLFSDSRQWSTFFAPKFFSFCSWTLVQSVSLFCVSFSSLACVTACSITSSCSQFVGMSVIQRCFSQDKRLCKRVPVGNKSLHARQH